MNETLILKLGGSILTNKKTTHRIRTDVIKRIGNEIKTALRRNPWNLIIVHGAGGAPHAAAKKYQNYKGPKTKKILLGMDTHDKVQQLNSEFIDVFHKIGIPAFTIHPSSIFSYGSNNRLRCVGLPIIEQLLTAGIIPVLYGDMIINSNSNYTVLSGDTIAILLGKKLRARRIIFATDVDGVYNDMQQKQVIQNLDARTLTKLTRSWKDYKGNDATGELPGKLQAIMQKHKNSTAMIINGLTKKNVYSSLIGEAIGTVIK